MRGYFYLIIGYIVQIHLVYAFTSIFDGTSITRLYLITIALTAIIWSIKMLTFYSFTMKEVKFFHGVSFAIKTMNIIGGMILSSGIIFIVVMEGNNTITELWLLISCTIFSILLANPLFLLSDSLIKKNIK